VDGQNQPAAMKNVGACLQAIPRSGGRERERVDPVPVGYRDRLQAGSGFGYMPKPTGEPPVPRDGPPGPPFSFRRRRKPGEIFPIDVLKVMFFLQSL
jgi:hypothetical protein